MWRAYCQIYAVPLYRHDKLVIQPGILLILVDCSRQRKIPRRFRLRDGLLPLRDRLLIYLKRKQIKPAVIAQGNALRGTAQGKILSVRQRFTGDHLNLFFCILYRRKKEIRTLSGRSRQHCFLWHADRLAFPVPSVQPPDHYHCKHKKDADNDCRAPQDVLIMSRLRMRRFAAGSPLSVTFGNLFCFRSSIHLLFSCLLIFPSDRLRPVPAVLPFFT